MRRASRLLFYSVALLIGVTSLSGFTTLWPKGLVPRFSVKANTFPGSDLDPRVGGELEVNEYLLSAGVGRFHEDGRFYNLMLTYGYHDYAFSDTAPFWNSEDGSVETLKIDAAFSTLTHGDLGPYLQVRATGGGGDGFGVSDARSLFAIGGLRWAYDGSLDLVFGALWWDSASEGTEVLPFAGLRWELSNNFILSTRNGVILEWMLDDWGDHWANFSLLYRSRDFALAPPVSSLPAAGEGVVEETAWELLAEYRWQLSRSVSFRLLAGYRFDRRYTYHLDETPVDRLTVDDGPVLGLECRFGF
ncbi:MAG: hypothetical protein ACFE0O_04840 [Opitutales bacterium]